MPSRHELEDAIVVLEAQRAILGDDVVEIALTALRQNLANLQTQPIPERYDEITVLVADLSDYTAMSELMDAEEVSDRINALWQKLDGAVEAWGGAIDKHTGDGVIALFGVPSTHNDDAERAVLAALDIQMELSLFNERASFSRTDQAADFTELRMRIGIDCGSVFFGRVGMRGEYTAVGDAVSRAVELQQMAPVNGILVSHDVFTQTQHRFDAKPVDFPAAPGETSQQTAFLVREENAEGVRYPSRTRNFELARMIGRQVEMEQLETMLQRVISTASARFAFIHGESGIGKSRLIHEFEQSLAMLPQDIRLFRGGTQRDTGQLPFALFRSVLLAHFRIHTRSSPEVTWAKLNRSVRANLGLDEAHAAACVYHLGHILGLDYSPEIPAESRASDSYSLREQAFSYVVQLFVSVVKQSNAVVLLLEDIQWADERSLDLIEHLRRECQDLPFMLVCSGRDSVLDLRPAWQSTASGEQFFHLHQHLTPLSSINTRHLITEIFHDSPRIPLDVADLIVERTGGNPAHIEDLSHILVESGVLSIDSNHWRIQLRKLQERQRLPTLTNLLQQRLDQLPVLELSVLQMASIMGRIFWKSAVEQLALAADDPNAAEQITAAISALERNGLIYHNRMPGFISEQEFVFSYNRLRGIAFDSIPLSERMLYHARAAAWLIVHSAPHVSEYAGIIALHFQESGDQDQAAKWYGRAGDYAKGTHAPETAVQHYRRALSLLPDDADALPVRITLNEALAETLRWQSQFRQALDHYEQMRHAAVNIGDFDAEARALLGIALTESFQQEYSAVLDSSLRAEELARKTDSPGHLAAALVARGWSLMHMNDIDAALEIAREALAVSTSAGAIRETAFSHALVGHICRLRKWHEQAEVATGKALALFRDLDDRQWQGLMFGNLGRIALARHNYAEGIGFFEKNLSIARDIGDYYGVMRSLRRLGSIFQMQYRYAEASERFTQANIFAEKSGNIAYRAAVAKDMGLMHLACATSPFLHLEDLEKQDHLQLAQSWLSKTLLLSEEANHVPTRAAALAGNARLLLELGHVEKGLVSAREAVLSAEMWSQSNRGRVAAELLAVAWRTLGQVVRETPVPDPVVTIEKSIYSPTACFERSLECVAQTEFGLEREEAQTLYQWASYELEKGDRDFGVTLWQRAAGIFSELGMVKESTWMGQSDLS